MSDLVLKEKDGTKKTYVGVKQIKIKKADVGFETFINPSGTKVIEDNGLHDVREFESVDIKVRGGDCPGRHIIEVDKLPQVNIDGDSLYLYNGTYYEPVRSAFVDIIAYDPARGPLSLLDDIPEEVEEVVLYILPEKTSNAEVSDMTTSFHFYFIRKENDIFVYTDTWHRLSEIEGLPGHGMITDTSEATQEGYYALFDPDAWRLEPLTNGGGGGGADLNIAYGDTPPEDTTKLWVKTAEPNGVIVSKDIGTAEGSGGFTTLTAQMPYHTSETSAVAIGRKVYLFGYKFGSASYYGTILCFDTESETLTALSATIPENRCPAATALVGNKVYLFGAVNGSNRRPTIYCFDTESETLTTLSATMPDSYGRTASCLFGNRVYFVGGNTNGPKDTIFYFDVETETITTLSTTLPIRAMSTAYVTIGSKMYLFGGYGYVDGNYVLLDTIFCFDAENETVTTLPSVLPKAMNYIYAAAIGTKIYLFGGTNRVGNGLSSNDTTYDTILCFDTVDETITTLSITLPERRGGFGSATVANKVYLFGGIGVRNGGTTTIFRFSEESLALSKDTLQIIPNDKMNVFHLINIDTIRVEIGVQTVYKGNANNEGELIEAALYKDGAWTTI